jgi:hypothetical protein
MATLEFFQGNLKGMNQRIFYIHNFEGWFSFQLLNVSHYWST